MVAYNAALAACRRSVPPVATVALELWNQLLAEGLRPDGITVAEAVASLERTGRCDEADAVYRQAIEKDALTKRSSFGGRKSYGGVGGVGGADAGGPSNGVESLDVGLEVDLSGMTLPLARCAVRDTLRRVRAGAGDVTFITGVGTRRPDTGTSSKPSLRQHVVEMLSVEMGLPARVPPAAPGCVIVRV